MNPADQGIPLLELGEDACSSKPRGSKSNFPLPLFSSTPNAASLFPSNPRLFSHRRRSSATTPTEVEAAQPPVSPSSTLLHRIASSKLMKRDSRRTAKKASSATSPQDAPSATLSVVTIVEDEAVEATPPVPPPIPTSLPISPSVHTLLPPKPKQEDENLGKMEHNLLSLLAKFKAGKLRAFVEEDTMEKMEAVRGQQEGLAQLHFSLHHAQAALPPNSADAAAAAERHSRLIVARLQELDASIQRLSWTDSTRTD